MKLFGSSLASVLVLATTFLILCVCPGPLSAQSLMARGPAVPGPEIPRPVVAAPQDAVPPPRLFAAYQYAFHAYALQEEQAAALEYQGESGAALRGSLMARFGLAAQTFAPFQKAALDYRQAELSAQSQMDAIRLAEQTSRTGAARLSLPAKALIRAVFVELKRQGSDAIDSIRRALDASAVHQLDLAVMNLYQQAEANGTRPGRQTGLLSLLSPRSNLGLNLGPVAHPDLGVKIYDPGGPDDGCSNLDVNEETNFAAECMDSGGDFDLDYCSCNDPGGDGSGGGGAPPEVTIIAWVNASAITLPGRAIAFGISVGPVVILTLSGYGSDSWLGGVRIVQSRDAGAVFRLLGGFGGSAQRQCWFA